MGGHPEKIWKRAVKEEAKEVGKTWRLKELLLTGSRCPMLHREQQELDR
jgi:hypothetical protein